MNDPLPSHAWEDLKFCIKSEDNNDEGDGGTSNAGLVEGGSNQPQGSPTITQQENTKFVISVRNLFHIIQTKFPENEQVKEKSTDSEEKEPIRDKQKKTKQKGQKGDTESKKYNTGRWTDEEHERFMKGIELFGKDWKKVQQYVGTRTSAQSRSHAQKVLAKTLYGKSSSAEFSTPKSIDLTPEQPEKVMKSKVEVDNTISGSKATEIQTPSIKNIEYFGEPIQVPRMRLHSSKDNEMEELVQSHKRKCTLDISVQENKDELLIEKDEVSQQLLQKLTTPKKMTKLMSFSYSKMEHFGFKLDFNSEIDSVDHDEFERKSACEFPSLNNFVADVIEDAYL